MAEIRLGRTGKVALVDDEDFDRLSRRWWATGRAGYAESRDKDGSVILMHREILGVVPGIWVDHINGDRLDNRRSNLRPATHQQNLMNRGTNKNNQSGYKGVYQELGLWRACIKINGRNRHLGNFDDAETAARAYDFAAHEAFGAFARLNFPDEAPAKPPKRVVVQTKGHQKVCEVCSGMFMGRIDTKFCGKQCLRVAMVAWRKSKKAQAGQAVGQ
jgi:hypothetical protein